VDAFLDVVMFSQEGLYINGLWYFQPFKPGNLTDARKYLI